MKTTGRLNTILILIVADVKVTLVMIAVHVCTVQNHRLHSYIYLTHFVKSYTPSTGGAVGLDSKTEKEDAALKNADCAEKM